MKIIVKDVVYFGQMVKNRQIKDAGSQLPKEWISFTAFEYTAIDTAIFVDIFMNMN